MFTMQISLYMHQMSMTGKFMAKDLEQRDVTVHDLDCLCRTKLTNSSPKKIIVHPADSNENGCWDSIKESILNNPTIHFYIIAMSKPKRIQYIGEHPNVTYLTERTMLDKRKNMIEIILE